MAITAYCLDWHVTTSNAFYDLLVNPLKPYTEVRLVGWDGARVPDEDGACPQDAPRIFCQFPPPRGWIAKTRVPVVWIAMGDSFDFYDQAWWNALPKSVRIVAFSSKVEQKARANGHPTLRLTYFVNPAEFRPARWDQGRVLLYWNRKGLVGPKFLEKLCAALDVDMLIFRSKIDPHFPLDASYRLPERLGKTRVYEYPTLTSSREEYLTLLRQANIFLAPRLYEGVGIANLEALASGCAVLAHNAPTMNEYIISGLNGYLFGWCRHALLNAVLWPIYRGWKNKVVGRIYGRVLHRSPPFSFSLTSCQNWPEVAALNLRALGESARRMHEIGYERWRTDLERYARFVLCC